MGVLKETGIVVGRVCVAHLFSFICCFLLGFFLLLLCLSSFCVLIPILSPFLDCPFGILSRLFEKTFYIANGLFLRLR